MEEQHQSRINLEVGDILNRSWELTKKHFPAFLLLLIMAQLVGGLPYSIYYGDMMTEFVQNGGQMDYEQMMDMYATNYSSGKLLFFSLIAILVGSYLYVVTLRLLNDVVSDEKADLTAAFKESYRNYLFFIGVYLVYCVTVGLSMLFFIVPGIYLGIRYMFSFMIAANRQDIAFGDAFSMSWQMTKGHFWKLFLFGIVSIGINLVGYACCCVGVLLTLIITYIMYALLYRELSKKLVSDY